VSGLGLDLVSGSHLGRVVGRHPGALWELFTPGELAGCGPAPMTEVCALAGRWALKEAAAKALAVPLRPTEIETPTSLAGCGHLRLLGQTQRAAGEGQVLGCTARVGELVLAVAVRVQGAAGG